MVLSAVWASIDNFSLVPFAGSWEGGLGFYLKIISGDYSVWLTNVLDHIFILGELLTWLDFRFFGGISVSIIILAFSLFSLSAILFCLLLKEINYAHKNRNAYISLSAILFAWIFLYMQAENMLNGWSFHNIAINFFSVLTFFLLYKNQTNSNNFYYKIAVIFICLLSSLTVISGLLLSPIVFIYIFFFGKEKKWSIAFILLTIISFYFYLKFGTEVVGKNSSRISLILGQPLDYLKFLLTYIGNPFWHLIHLNKFGKNFALLMGLIYLVLFFNSFIKEICKKKHSQINLALLFFIIFSIFFACSVSYGRFENGIDQALVGRYSTQAIFSWAALFVLYSPYFVNQIKRPNKFFYSYSFLLIFLMSLNQTKALRFHNEISNINLAGLAISMGVSDQKLIEDSVWHSAHRVIEITREAKEKKIGFINFYPYNQIGKPFPFFSNVKSCNVKLQNNYLLENDNRYNFFTGDFYDVQNKKIPKFLYLFDESRNIIGYALTGKISKLEKSGSNYGFKGYYLNRAEERSIYVMSLFPKCQNRVDKLFDSIIVGGIT